MESWEAGPTAYAGPASLVRQSRAEPGPLRVSGTTPLWLDVIDTAIRTCTAHGRAEMAEWLSHRRTQLLHPELRVLVVGAAKQGKSQLINALINAPVCAVDPDAGTVLPTVVRNAETANAHLIRRASPTADWVGMVAPPDRIPLALDRLTSAVADTAARLPDGAPAHVEVGVPRSLLAAGLVLIDTPALPGLPGSAPRAVAEARELSTYSCADVVLFACESGRELSDAELAVLADLARLFPSLLVVFTKTDYAADWRRILARSRDRLTQAGVPAAVTAVSAALRLHAVKAADPALNNESGFTDLLLHLQQMVAAKPHQLAPATVGVLSRIAIEQLATPLREELTTQRNAGVSDAVSRLHATQRRLDDLRRCSARWQNCLSDEVGDLMSDIEHDLRERTRAVLAGADEFLATADPAKTWDEFEPWLRQALQDLAQTSQTWLAQRAQWVARRVADQFPPDTGDVLPPEALVTLDELPDRVTGIDAPPVARFGPGQKLFIGLRGSYGGVVMFGLVTSLAGMSLINPISIGGGALFGGKSVRDEGKSLLKRRQAEAKNAVQRHVDDVFAGLNKDARDTVRRLQRALRDHFSAVTEDLQEVVMESLRSAKAAADLDVAVREQHARRIEQEMGRLAALQLQAQALTGRPGPAVTDAPSTVDSMP
jgi:Dynamin family